MNMMAENTEPFELEQGTLYYVAGKGILEFKGELDKSRLDKAEAKSYRNAKIVYRFKPHSIFSEEKKEVHLADYSMRGGLKVYPLSSGSALEETLRLIRGKRGGESGHDSDHHAVPFQLDTLGLSNVAKVIRDYKRFQNDPNIPKARLMLAQAVAYHLDALPGEANDYIKVLIKAAEFPEELSYLPKHREAMLAVVNEYKEHNALSPEFVASLEALPVARRHGEADKSKVVSLYPVKPKLSAEQSILTQFGSATQPVSMEREDVPLESAVGTAPSTPPASPVVEKVQKHKPEKIKPVKEKNLLVINAAGSKFIFTRGLDRDALYKQDTDLYRAFEQGIEHEALRKVCQAAAGKFTQGEMVDLSRILIGQTSFDISNLITAKNKGLDKPEWDQEKVKDHYDSLMKKLLEPLSEEGLAAVQEEVDKFNAILHPTRKARELPPEVTEKPSADASTTGAESPVSSSQEVEVKSLAAVIPPAPNPPQLQKDDDDELSVTGTFKIAILRNPEEKFDPETEYALDWTLNPDVHLPVALTAAKKLSPIAFKVFTRHHMRGQDYEQIAKAIGTDESTVRSIFHKAATAVGNALQRQADVVRADAGLDCHKSEPG